MKFATLSLLTLCFLMVESRRIRPHPLYGVSCSEAKAKLEKIVEEAGGPMPGMVFPRCEKDGSYEPVQCRGSQCVCVSKEGHPIGYTVGRWKEEGMNCKCARKEWAVRDRVGVMFNCKENGNFAPKQCTGSVCFCADHNGEQIGEETVHIGELDTLECEGDDKAHPKRPRRPPHHGVSCLEANAKLKKMVEEAGRPLLGMTFLRCEEDGSYGPVQCRGSQCMCVSKEGELIGYMTARWKQEGMNCKCARKEWSVRDRRGLIFNCKKNGNFAPKQCTGSVCFCADHNGKQVGEETVNIGELDTLECEGDDEVTPKRRRMSKYLREIFDV